MKAKTTPRGIISPAWKIAGMLDGRVTQWRVPYKGFFLGEEPAWPDSGKGSCPLGKPGDRLFVKETWADVNTEGGPAFMYADGALRFCSDDAYPVEYERYPNCQFSMWSTDLWFRKERKCESDHRWRSPVAMPAWAARIWLEIESVRVERVQEISEADALDEGICFKCFDRNCNVIRHAAWPIEPTLNDPSCAVDVFRRLWQSRHPGSWDRNDWVWCLSFRRVEAS